MTARREDVADPPKMPAPGEPATAPTASSTAVLKLVIELAPLAVWLIAFKVAGIIPATEALVVATLLSVAAAYFLLGKISPALIVTAVMVVVFGGLTIGFNEPRFIKIKPTVINLMFAGGLAYGLYFERNFLKLLFGEAMHLTAEGWRLLTLRWIGLFVALAVLNEIVWRTTDTPALEYIWGYFKFPGMFVITFLYTIANIPLMKKFAATPTDT